MRPQGRHCLQQELALYDAELLQRPALVIATHVDMLGDQAHDHVTALQQQQPLQVVPVSGLHGAGVPQLKEALWQACAPKPMPDVNAYAIA